MSGAAPDGGPAATVLPPRREFFPAAQSNAVMQKRALNLAVSAAAALLAAAWLAAPARPQEADASAEPAAQAAGPKATAPDTADGRQTSGGEESAAKSGSASSKAGAKAGQAGQKAAKAAAAEGPPEDGGPLVLEDAPDDSVLDDQTYGGENDEFIPSEEIPVDEPIPYPTDI